MKLCIPIVEINELESRVNAHFGSAPCFFVYDTAANSSLFVRNDDASHEHGMCCSSNNGCITDRQAHAQDARQAI